MPIPAVAGVLAGGVFDLLKGWLERKYPDPKERAKEELELQQYLSTKDQAELQQFYDFVVKYEGEGDKVAPELQIYRGSVRPTVTYALVIAFVWGIMDGWSEAYIDLLYRLNLISMGFWYGERAMKNLGLDLGNLFKKK